MTNRTIAAAGRILVNRGGIAVVMLAFYMFTLKVPSPKPIPRPEPQPDPYPEEEPGSEPDVIPPLRPEPEPMPM